MKRYQVYLNSHSVALLDDIEKITSISRSKVIRELVDRFVDQMAKVFTKERIPSSKLTYLDQLVGSIKLKTSKPTNFALDDDEIYLKD